MEDEKSTPAGKNIQANPEKSLIIKEKNEINSEKPLPTGIKDPKEEKRNQKTDENPCVACLKEIQCTLKPTPDEALNIYAPAKTPSNQSISPKNFSQTTEHSKKNVTETCTNGEEALISTTENKIKLHELTLSALFDAYYDCRRRKRNTMQSMKFEWELEKNLFKLYQDLKDGTYEIGKSICFIVTVPKPREVWAGAFRDRIVHHLIYNAIKERFENRFIFDTFSCIPKRGTLAGSHRAAKFARAVTENYTKKAYFMKADISNYFNSIDKEILFKIIQKYVPEKWLIELIEKVVFHDPKTNVYIKSDKKLWEKLPKNKSMFNNIVTKGVPIGNLTSQFFSNVYLNELDQYVKHELKIKYYCRYVDDVLLLHEDVKYLNHCYDKIDKFLKENLELCLNPRKKNINLVCRGFDFVGHVIKPNRTFLRTTIIKNSFRTINQWKKKKNRFEDAELEIFRNKINSYLGMFKHVNGYRLRKKICEKATTLFTVPDSEYTKIMIVKSNQIAPVPEMPKNTEDNPPSEPKPSC